MCSGCGLKHSKNNAKSSEAKAGISAPVTVPSLRENTKSGEGKAGINAPATFLNAQDNTQPKEVKDVMSAPDVSSAPAAASRANNKLAEVQEPTSLVKTSTTPQHNVVEPKIGPVSEDTANIDHADIVQGQDQSRSEVIPLRPVTTATSTEATVQGKLALHQHLQKYSTSLLKLHHTKMRSHSKVK